mmetsp:Transcript_67188/g.132491  ORF Transcript_67188/g.132491 Transcript_67188/m.132491 type:complete len:232 (+) Transcript_67188:495-1190(+)
MPGAATWDMPCGSIIPCMACMFGIPDIGSPGKPCIPGIPIIGACSPGGGMKPGGTIAGIIPGANACAKMGCAIPGARACICMPPCLAISQAICAQFIGLSCLFFARDFFVFSPSLLLDLDLFERRLSLLRVFSRRLEREVRFVHFEDRLSCLDFFEDRCLLRPRRGADTDSEKLLAAGRFLRRRCEVLRCLFLVRFETGDWLGLCSCLCRLCFFLALFLGGVSVSAPRPSM